MNNTHTHTHTHPFNGPFSGTTQVSRYQKGKPIWILLKQETVSGSGISWAICKSAPRPRQITMQHTTTQFLQAGCPSCRPTKSVKALKALINRKIFCKSGPRTTNSFAPYCCCCCCTGYIAGEGVTVSDRQDVHVGALVLCFYISGFSLLDLHYGLYLYFVFLPGCV